MAIMRFEEFNDSEGETWKVYTQISDADVEYISKLQEIMDNDDTLSESYDFSLFNGTWEQAEIVAGEAILGYYASHSLGTLKDDLSLPALYEKVSNMEPWDVNDVLYKLGAFNLI